MNGRIFIVAGLFLASLAIYGCGQGAGDAAGLNGGITVTASAEGTFVTATATYTNPTKTNLIGVPITFSYQVGGQSFSLGEHNTNNSGSVGVAFTPSAFNGAQTILVIASTGNLQNFTTVTMTGRSLSLTPPPAIAATTAAASGTIVDVAIPAATVFATLSDPFSVSGALPPLTLAITTSAVSSLTNTLDLLAPTTTTNATGTAPFPGATAHMTVPAAIGGVNTMTITWTVTNLATGLSATGITTITLTKTA